MKKLLSLSILLVFCLSFAQANNQLNLSDGEKPISGEFNTDENRLYPALVNEEIELKEPQEQAPCFDIISQDISCFGEEDGSILVLINSECGPVVDICLQYDNSKQNCMPDKFIGQAEYTGLIAGTYLIVVTGANGLVTTEEVTINEPELLVAMAVAEELTICPDSETTVTITAQGGTEPYTGTGEFTVGEGMHTFTVTDANDCIAYVEITIEAFPVIDVVCREDIFIGQFAHTIVLEGSAPEGGVYEGTGVSYDTETGNYLFSAQVAGPGSYTISYTVEENGCYFSCEFTIEVYEMPDFSCIENVEICADEMPLENLLPEGDEGWLSGTGIEDNVFYPEISGTGNFEITYTIADEFGYLYSCTFFISVYELPEVTLAPFDAVCSNTEPFMLTGGLPEGGEYTGTGIVDGVFDPLALEPGVYEITYTYTNENNCTDFAVQTLEILQAPCIEVSHTDISCYGEEDGTITVTITCGNVVEICLVAPGQEMEKCTADKFGSTIHTGLVAGTYYIVVTDANGCVTIEEVTILEPELLEIELVDIGSVSGIGAADGFIEIAATGGTPEYEYLWDNGNTTSRIENLDPGVYSVVVFDANNCSAAGTWEVTGPSEPGDLLVDLGVTIEVNIQTPDPEEVDELIFALVVTNYNEEDATGVIVENIIPEPFPFISRLDDGTSGSFNPVGGTWAIGTIPAGEYVILVYRTQMLLTEEEEEKSWQMGVNTAQILPFDQTDPNLANNYAEITVTVGESTGGDDNGIESNGSMASQMALRNHRRLVESNPIARQERTVKMDSFTHSDILTGTVKTASLDGNATGISMLLPEKGPAQTKAFVSTPADLIGITNAREIFSVDYLQENNARRAAILAISTRSSSVYEHTKVICDRLAGAELRSIEMIEIAGRPFILSKLVHPGGYVDYSVSFISQQQGGQFIIDNRWYNEEYEILDTEDIFNFQVWSVAPQFTRELVEDILEMMEQNGGVSFRNEEIAPSIPQVYVQSGHYGNGGIMLNLVNKAGADKITIYGNKSLYENGPREPMHITVDIPTNELVEVFIPTGYLFDAGFSVSNNRDDAPDILYYADGAWMFDFDPGNSIVTNFRTSAEKAENTQIDYKVERDASFSGRVRTWATMFRTLSPRNMPVDMTHFDQIVFTAHGAGTTEVMLSKAGIHQWNEQFRTTITLTEKPREYRIKFSDLVTREGENGFTAEDLVSVIFNPIGNGNTASAFDVTIENLHFANSSFIITPAAIFYPAYPNPFRRATQIDLMVTQDSHVKVEVVNLYGQTVEVLANNEMSTGTYKLNWTPAGHMPGVYMIRMTVGEEVYTSKVVYNR